MSSVLKAALLPQPLLRRSATRSADFAALQNYFVNQAIFLCLFGGEPAVAFDSVSFPAGSTALGFTLFSSHRSVSPTAPQADWIGLVEAMKQELATTESRLRTERADSTATHIQFLEQARAAEAEVKRLTAQVEDMRNGQRTSKEAAQHVRPD